MIKETQIMFIYEYDTIKLILKSFKEIFIILVKSQKHFYNMRNVHLSTKMYQQHKLMSFL